MGAEPTPLGKQSTLTHIPLERELLLLPKGLGWLGKAFNPGVCFCSFVLIRFHTTALTFVLLLAESPTLGGNLVSFSECRRVQAKPYSPPDSDVPGRNRGDDKELMLG